jgi:myo-inositol-1(or 4)-monophosphatase
MSDRSFETFCPFVNIMARAAFKASKGLIRDFGEVENLQISAKGTRDFVSVADRRSERTLFRELQKAYPDFSFHMEESGRIEGTKDMTFVIDPLDGTLNFLHGLPHFAITMGLLSDNKPIAGITFDPIRDELFWASKDKGAFLGRRRLRLSPKTRPCTHLIGINHVTLTPDAHSVAQETANLRISGSAALDLAYVAAGRLDGFIGHNMPIWDQAAGILMIDEARGLVKPAQDSNHRYTTACTPALEDTLCTLVSTIVKGKA